MIRSWREFLWAWAERFQTPAPPKGRDWHREPTYPPQVVAWGAGEPQDDSPAVEPPGDVLRFVDDAGGGRFHVGRVALHAGDGLDVLYQLGSWANDRNRDAAGLGVWLPCRFEYRLPPAHERGREGAPAPVAFLCLSIAGGSSGVDGGEARIVGVVGRTRVRVRP